MLISSDVFKKPLFLSPGIDRAKLNGFHMKLARFFDLSFLLLLCHSALHKFFNSFLRMSRNSAKNKSFFTTGRFKLFPEYSDFFPQFSYLLLSPVQIVSFFLVSSINKAKPFCHLAYNYRCHKFQTLSATCKISPMSLSNSCHSPLLLYTLIATIGPTHLTKYTVLQLK